MLHELEGRQGGQKGVGRTEAQLKAPRAAASLPSQSYSETKASWAASTCTHHTPPTQAPPGVMVLSRSSWHQLLPVPSRGMCSDKSGTQNLLQKDAFWDINHSLFKCCCTTSVGVWKRKKLNRHSKPKHHSRREKE